MAEHRRDIDLLIEVLGRDAGLNKSYEKYFEGKFTRGLNCTSCLFYMDFITMAM